MKLAVRRASLTEDRQEMLALLKRNRPESPDLGFDWRYTLNPSGQACSWLLYHEGNEQAVGMASLFPRAMYVDRKPMLAGQIMHFVVDSSHRSLGPAVLLQRATFEPVNSGALDFCYDCPPHDQGMSTFVRLGMRPNCEVIRNALLLRTDEYIERRMGTGPLTKPAVAAANLLLCMPRARRVAPGLEIHVLNSPFDEEFSALDKLVAAEGVVAQRRSAEDLNWRYRENPEHQYQILVARRGGELLAFAVFVVRPEGVTDLVELFGRELSEVGASLLATVVEECRRQKRRVIYGYCSEDSQLKRVFRASGFRPRERVVRVVAYANPNGLASRLFCAGAQWSFGHAEMSG